MREHPTWGVHIAGLGEEAVVDSAALLRLAASAERQRAVASTAMNERSSRAHSICRLTIRTVCSRKETRHSVLQLIDLAGSEVPSTLPQRCAPSLPSSTEPRAVFCLLCCVVLCSAAV